MRRPDRRRMLRLAPPAIAALLLIAAGLLSGCRKDDPADAPLLGTLEWDRIGVPAEVSEPILRIAVHEGQAVKAGDLLMVLDARRKDARQDEADAAVAQAQARVDELAHGSRSEEIDAARAAVASAQASQAEAQKQFARYEVLGRSQVVARASVDAARATRDRAVAQVAAAQAQLRELAVGVRPEQQAQAQAALASAQAAQRALQLDRARLEVHAPRDGRVDALPFKAGDQPPVGGILCSLLVGEAPYARVFVPESRRVGLREGQRFDVQVHGGKLAHATLRSIAQEAAFTPYYALTGDDASRLVYRAELVLTDADAATLPAGVPVQARLAH